MTCVSVDDRARQASPNHESGRARSARPTSMWPCAKNKPTPQKRYPTPIITRCVVTGAALDGSPLAMPTKRDRRGCLSACVTSGVRAAAWISSVGGHPASPQRARQLDRLGRVLARIPRPRAPRGAAQARSHRRDVQMAVVCVLVGTSRGVLLRPSRTMSSSASERSPGMTVGRQLLLVV
jgi:hypothetical protein